MRQNLDSSTRVEVQSTGIFQNVQSKACLRKPNNSGHQTAKQFHPYIPCATWLAIISIQTKNTDPIIQKLNAAYQQLPFNSLEFLAQGLGSKQPTDVVLL